MSSDLSSSAILLSSDASYRLPSIRWKLSMNSLFVFLHFARYSSRLSLMLSCFPLSTSHITFLRSRLSGGARCCDANSIALSRLLVCLMYVTM